MINNLEKMKLRLCKGKFMILIKVKFSYSNKSEMVEYGSKTQKVPKKLQEY